MKELTAIISGIILSVSAYAADKGFVYSHEHQPSPAERQAAQREYNPIVKQIIEQRHALELTSPPTLGQQVNPTIQSRSGVRVKAASAQ
jgi:hypothetical protein